MFKKNPVLENRLHWAVFLQNFSVYKDGLWEVIRNVYSQDPTPDSWVKGLAIRVLASPAGDSDAS